MLRGLLPARELPGRLDHRIHAQLRPRKCRGLLHREDAGAAVLRDDMSVLERERATEPTHHRVVTEQVDERSRVEDVVDRHHFDIRATIENAEHRAPDATKTVDGDFHARSPLSSPA